MFNARSQKKDDSVEEAFAAWRRDPAYVVIYAAIEAEFAYATATAHAQRISSESVRAQ